MLLVVPSSFCLSTLVRKQEIVISTELAPQSLLSPILALSSELFSPVPQNYTHQLQFSLLVSCTGFCSQDSKCRAHIPQLPTSLAMTDIDNQAKISCQFRSSSAALKCFSSDVSGHLLLTIKHNEQQRLNLFAIPVAKQLKMQLQAEIRIKKQENSLKYKVDKKKSWATLVLTQIRCVEVTWPLAPPLPHSSSERIGFWPLEKSILVLAYRFLF